MIHPRINSYLRYFSLLNVQTCFQRSVRFSRREFPTCVSMKLLWKFRSVCNENTVNRSDIIIILCYVIVGPAYKMIHFTVVSLSLLAGRNYSVPFCLSVNWLIYQLPALLPFSPFLSLFLSFSLCYPPSRTPLSFLRRRRISSGKAN